MPVGKVLALSAFLLWIGPERIAEANDRCLDLLSHVDHPKLPFDDLWDSKETFLDNFKPFHSVLMLAEGNTLFDARLVARTYPDKTIFGTTNRIYPVKLFPNFAKDLKELPNLKARVVDTTKRFPLDDNQFDLVFMKAGLCRCFTGEKCCAGIRWNIPHMRSFFREVVRVMNKNNPNSVALLHGGIITEEEMNQWLKALNVKEFAKIKVDVLRRPETGTVFALRFTPRPGTGRH